MYLHVLADDVRETMTPTRTSKQTNEVTKQLSIIELLHTGHFAAHSSLTMDHLQERATLVNRRRHPKND